MGSLWTSLVVFRLPLINMSPSVFLAFLFTSWVELVYGHTRATDVIYYFDAVMPAGTTKCGPQTLTGWTVRYDRYRPDDGGSGKKQDNVYFNSGTGTFTAPLVQWKGNSVKGVYSCCASARCKKGGHCDFTLTREDGTVSGAFGTRLSGEWISHEVCTIERMKQGETLKVQLQSGAGSDCLEETGWNYARFSCHFISVS